MLAALAQFSLKPLRRYRLQSLLAVIGVAIGVANIIMLISITDLGRHQTMGLINDLGANLVIVMPYIDSKSGALGQMSSTFSPNHLPQETLATVRSVAQIRKAAGAMLLPGHVSRGETSIATTLQGVSQEFSELRGHEVAAGRWMNAADETEHARVAFIGDTVRQRLFENENAVGQTVEIRGEQFTVAGVMVHKGIIGFEDVDNRVYLPLSSAQDIFEFEGIHGIFSAYRDGVSEIEAVEAVKAALAKTVKPGEIPEETFSVITIKEATELMDNTLGIFRKVLLGISSIAMLVAGIGIMNVMLIQVLQRRFEIGVRRSVGATSRAILLQFLGESVAQALIGAVVGSLIGIVGVYAYCLYSHWTMYINPRTVLLGIGYSIVIGVLFGSYPAWRAAKLDPIKSLRMEY
jgi:putative ABC transport system permease protein